MMKQLKSYAHPPPSGDKPKQLVIFLHGYGANGRDLLGLSTYFAQMLPEAVFVSPNAPFATGMGADSYQWFSLENWSPETLLKGIKVAAPILEDFILEQMDRYQISADKTALVGFSQGTMMSLYVGPRFPKKLAGIVGYSGALIWDFDTIIPNLQKTPVHLVHGDADDVVPLMAYHLAKTTLMGAGIPLSGGITSGLGHNIDEAGLRGAAEFLRSVLV